MLTDCVLRCISTDQDTSLVINEPKTAADHDTKTSEDYPSDRRKQLHLQLNQHHPDDTDHQLDHNEHVTNPTFKTPGKCAPHTPSSRQNKSPTELRHGGLSTPQSANGHIYNPFEHDAIKHLQGPMFSPNVFTRNGTSTPRKNECVSSNGAFVWTIDERAILFPAEIDNMPHHQEHLNSICPADHTETEVQAAIDTFFSSQQIVPSPWTDPEHATRASQSMNPTPSRAPRTPAPSRVNRTDAAKEVGCQTSLSIPMDIDLMGLLGAFHNDNHTERDDAVEVVLSTSGTLRRKLFAHQAISPLRPGATGDDHDLNTPPSPHPQIPYSPLATPSSAHFSSSPIHSLSSGRMSSSPGQHVVTGYQSDSGPRRPLISARLFPLTGSDEVVSGSHEEGVASPLSSPDISPIKIDLISSPADDTGVETDGLREERCANGSSSFNSESPCGQFMDCVDMETSANDGHQATGIGYWGLSTIGESLDTDDAIDCDVISSETGYQTGSIQDSQHHTNLTQQLSQLPLDSMHQSSIDISPKNSSRYSSFPRKEFSRELYRVSEMEAVAESGCLD